MLASPLLLVEGEAAVELGSACRNLFGRIRARIASRTVKPVERRWTRSRRVAISRSPEAPWCAATWLQWPDVSEEVRPQAPQIEQGLPQAVPAVVDWRGRATRIAARGKTWTSDLLNSLHLDPTHLPIFLSNNIFVYVDGSYVSGFHGATRSANGKGHPTDDVFLPLVREAEPEHHLTSDSERHHRAIHVHG